jgi:branched-chain amino acid transport system ATP-binding protein
MSTALSDTPATTTKAAVLEATGVTLRYGAVTAVDDVNISVAPGILHGVIGPNGAGKSSFMDALSGRRKLSSGTVRLGGEDITKRSVTWRRRNGMARSFQKTSVFGAMTVRTQLDMVGRKTGEDDMDGVIDALSLRPYLDEVCSAIAYGHQRRVDIAMALLGRPHVVLLDEPGAGLSVEESVQMFDHIRALATDRNVAVVLVEHDVEGVFRVCDEITVLNLGAVLASGTPADVRAHPEVIKAYLGSEA